MNQALKKDLIIWFFLWFIFWGGFLLIRKSGFDYSTHPLAISAYFILSSAIIISLYKNHLHPYVKKFNAKPIILLIIVLALATFTPTILEEKADNAQDLFETENDSFLNPDKNYLFSKAFEILFQQTLIVLLVSFFIELKLTLKKSIQIFLIIFAIAHFPILFLEGLKFGAYYFGASLLAAIIFPILIEKVNLGFIYAYSIHYAFYILSAIIFNLI